MPRRPRSIRPGRVYHLISRFVDREWFIRTEDERGRYLELLGHALDECDWRCLAHAVMNNHIHLSLVAGEQSLDSWIRRVHSPFADWMNRSYERIGNIFVRGPKDIETPAERVGALIAYIHNNPVRAGVVVAPGASDWTSHRAYLGLERAPRWLHLDEGLTRAGFDDPGAFDQWVRTHPSEREIMDVIARADEQDDVDLAQPADPDPATIVRLAADTVGIPVAQLCSRRRSAIEVLGRRVAVYCAGRVGIRGAQIALALGQSQQAVSATQLRGADSVVVRVGNHVLEKLKSASGLDPLP